MEFLFLDTSSARILLCGAKPIYKSLPNVRFWPIADIARSIRSARRRARPRLSWRDEVDQGPLYGSGRWSHALCKAAWAASSVTLAQKRSRTRVSLPSYLAVANARKSTGISLIDTNKDIRLRVTQIKRFSKDMLMCHTPCRLTSTHRRR